MFQASCSNWYVTDMYMLVISTVLLSHAFTAGACSFYYRHLSNLGMLNCTVDQHFKSIKEPSIFSLKKGVRNKKKKKNSVSHLGCSVTKLLLLLLFYCLFKPELLTPFLWRLLVAITVMSN